MTANLKIGAHLSIKKGYFGAAKEAFRYGMGAFQYFPKNPRSLSVKSFDLRDAEQCREFCLTHQIVSVAHTPYPSNLAIDRQVEPEQFQRIVMSLRNDLEIAEACGSIGIVVHFGTFKARNPLHGYQNIIQCINEVLLGWNGSSKLLIENQAGNHGDMGMTMEEMISVKKLCASPERMGFCLDTCHAFASGLWPSNKNMDRYFSLKGSQLDYWEGLSVIHLNDSRYPGLSRKDRHARVGQGYIGEAGFKDLFQREALRELLTQEIPLIFETEPGEDGTYSEDMKKVQRWINA
ncbi:deoxyribonuclease-4 [Fontibacillus solani]|uniref:Deoxyribonuclease-4 n=1 Tax=Fontibacillus solani TaxID=1572857 RepID=A0A7W3SPY9_9BACL|nr:deoxyribonuclease IV [Fontibacillus solani]MBA9084073.1 deoxyribonuclease-4 [Fontibacillus solani]